MTTTHLRLHVNIDHVATLRQARRGIEPNPVDWALAAEAAGAEGITCHLRVDRRHIQDNDVRELRQRIATLLNFELSLAPEIVEIALEIGAEAFCLVPENRQEVTTEGGLNVVGEATRLATTIPRLAATGGVVSLFIDPDEAQVRASADSGAPFIELHTGAFAEAWAACEREGVEAANHESVQVELARLQNSTALALDLGLRVNAGHGLNYVNVLPVAAIPGLEELNIGHSIVSRAVFSGVEAAVREMRALMAAQ